MVDYKFPLRLIPSQLLETYLPYEKFIIQRWTKNNNFNGEVRASAMKK